MPSRRSSPAPDYQSTVKIIANTAGGANGQAVAIPKDGQGLPLATSIEISGCDVAYGFGFGDGSFVMPDETSGVGAKGALLDTVASIPGGFGQGSNNPSPLITHVVIKMVGIATADFYLNFLR